MFKIITKGKAELEKSSSDDYNTKEAIYTIYKKDDNFMIFLNWNGFFIPMNGVTISQIFDDIIDMLEELLDTGSHKFSVNFLDTCFTADWEISCKKEDITIKSKWIEIAPFSFENTSLEDLKKVSDTVVINKNIFINEWNNLLKIIKSDLLIAGYNDQLEGYDYLDALN